MYIYILNRNLEPLAIVDQYKSLIWTSRYNESGACELYVEANMRNIEYLRKGNYIARDDDYSMVCLINRVELDTDRENGNYLIVNGVDCKELLNRRIIWGSTSVNESTQAFLNYIVSKSLYSSGDSDRNMKKANGGMLFTSTGSANLPEQTSAQISYANVGETVVNYCKNFGWGYKVSLVKQSGVYRLKFSVYKGTDRADSVIFSDEFENLISTKYVSDDTNIGNVALVAGEGTDTDRTTTIVGTVSGTDRAEIYVDARDLSSVGTYENLNSMYPGGQIREVATGAWEYWFNALNIAILSESHKEWLIANYSHKGARLIGWVTTINGAEYFRMVDTVDGIAIASMSTASPTASTEVQMYDLIYISLLQERGLQKLSEYSAVQSFEGFIAPNVTFIFNLDYFLGDVVMVKNLFGISAKARIIEVTETFDENGHTINPKFEYIRTFSELFPADTLYPSDNLFPR